MIYYTATDDIKVTAELYAEWLGHTPGFKGIAYNERVVVAKDGNKVIGAAIVIMVIDRIFDRAWALVENVYVLKKYRNKGIGKGLMKFIETQYLVSGEVAFIKLTSGKDDGIRLYRNLGYEEGSSFRKDRVV